MLCLTPKVVKFKISQHITCLRNVEIAVKKQYNLELRMNSQEGVRVKNAQPLD